MYNAIFSKLKKYCDREKCSNFFSHITAEELIELNLLLDKVILFCENTDEDTLDCYEGSHDIFSLYELVNRLSDKDN